MARLRLHYLRRQAVEGACRTGLASVPRGWLSSAARAEAQTAPAVRQDWGGAGTPLS